MTNRKNLIVLLKGNLPYHSNEVAYWSDEHIGALADHLLANGVVVREKGEWEIREDSYGNELMWCPLCHEEFYDGDNDTVDHTPNFCPNCGADMRKGENDGL